MHVTGKLFLKSLLVLICGWMGLAQVAAADAVSAAGGSGSPAAVLLESDALVADYSFAEGAGAVVYDISGVAPVMHLAVSNQNGITWLDGALWMQASRTLLWSEDLKLYNECAATDEITISAWIQPAALCMSGPTRTVTFSRDTSSRNFTLGTENMTWVMRLRTTDVNDNGMPNLAAGGLETRIQHVVYTRKASGEEVIYVDGEQKTTGTRTGTFENWDASHVFALGNEINPNDDRQFYGVYHRVSLYSKALTASEVRALNRQGHALVNPVPSIRANNRRGGVAVAEGDPVTLSVTINAGAYAGWDVDWFVIAVPHAGGDWHYVAPDMQWVGFTPNVLADCRPAHRGPLMNIYNPVKLLDNYRSLPVGVYDFYFVVDYPENGRLDMTPGYHVFDMVRVVVAEAD